MTRSRVLVTGGAGFLGSHLCDRLIADGHEVICLDDLSTGSRANLADLFSHPRFSFVERDVTLPFFAPVDRVFNLACPASPKQYQRDPVATVRTNVMGMIQTLDLARATSARVLQASTSEVYGDPEVHPQPESYVGHVDPLSTRACYDEGKRCAETLCSDYHREYGVDVRIARIFNTYGPRMALDDGRVVSNFVLQALRGEPITVYGDGSYTRSFQYVDDLVEGLVRLMDHEGATGPWSPVSPVNLGESREISMLALAKLVVERTGSRSPIVHLPALAHDPKQRRADASLALRVLGWAPTVALDDGLDRTIAHFRERLAAID